MIQHFHNLIKCKVLGLIKLASYTRQGELLSNGEVPAIIETYSNPG